MVSARRPHASTQTETRAGPAVVEGTLTAAQARHLDDAIAASTVDARLWTGAFATNVWGGRYAIDGVLGEGSQGTTFVGTDLKTGGRVAVKVFDLGRAKDWKAQELFDREVQTLKDIDHPAVPKLLDVIIDADTGARAQVRTLIAGDSLKDIVQREGPLREAALWSILVDAADVLGALHARSSPIVHRDLKPSNLIRRTDGTTCLVDFGGVGGSREAAGSTVVGTFGYMAPEQLYGAQTPATDMYSLGATLLALATGKEPEDLPRDGLALDVDKAVPRLSERMRALLKKLTAPDPKARPQDAQHLLGDLKTIARPPDDNGEIDVDPSTERLLREASADAPDLFVGVIALVLGVLGVAGSVVVGQLLLPLILTILAALSSPPRRARLHRTKARIHEAAHLAKAGFERTALHGARKLEEVGSRDAKRRHLRKQAQRARRREKLWL
jgi:serine/threonine protein kinase